MKELHIKNMVCNRCIKAVYDILEKEHLAPAQVALGKVTLREDISADKLASLRTALEEEGFMLIDDRRSRMIEAIKNAVIEKVHYGDLSEMKEKFSVYLSDRLHEDYNYLSALFSEVENNTIEHYIILQKVEKIKELLVYDEWSLGEIAFQLGYSSVAHLSAQFKKTTGFTPSQFKQLKEHRRKPLDEV